ncbi:RNA polymerase, sigma-24 subunit, ECF subfamily [Pseudopedobacter saltans DSM 12145]|uniref:RNA polymerase, sigma-24 subunit, ECF subfamily n=1 Tax=Pseudopedobacter saltans (strain ATCC 51119 / DSM 12145 / JCM 21818 / CCUG 39354 / LMG 10337 / NBRC 100064 / NCIMB 13643) TaxID=762903 RepID=F0S8R3_PSESL|nr:sigma-70 family RNA polymerase sigma factor [Pseudopedobacter saltans]ADY52394.1 RNA polymerase, sigma-24 subunit, ECF subfamily [Pseudopedobacter saltans DSM 12145]
MEINPNFSENARNDYNLVQSARSGNQRAYAELMHRYKDSIYFMVLKMVNNKDDAMDLTVSTFAKAFENLDKYKADFAFSTWLFRIATNGSIDFIRKKRIVTTSIDSVLNDEGEEYMFSIQSNDMNPEESSIKKQQGELLKDIVNRLPDRYRTLVVLRYFDELSYEEIAEQLMLPLGTVKAQLFRARDLLSNILNKQKKTGNEF